MSAEVKVKVRVRVRNEIKRLKKRKRKLRLSNCLFCGNSRTEVTPQNLYNVKEPVFQT